MPRNLQITLGVLVVAVLIGLISLRGLHKRIENLSENTASEEQERRELLKPAISTPSDVLVAAKIFWAAGPDAVAPSEVDLPLSADPGTRGRQVLDALIAKSPSPEQRTLPADAVVLGFYVLPDGTAIADFSDALASETPSGIASEQLAVDSIARTLEANLPAAHRLKILIHGQEVETLAGHADLTGLFDLNPPVSTATAAEAAANPVTARPAPTASGAASNPSP